MRQGNGHWFVRCGRQCSVYFTSCGILEYAIAYIFFRTPLPWRDLQPDVDTSYTEAIHAVLPK